MTLQEILWKNKEVTPISIRSKSGKLHLYVKKYIGRTGVVQGEAKNGMLSNVQGKCVLISTDGDFYSKPVLYLCRNDIQQEVFDLACGSAVGLFERVDVQCDVQ